MYGFIVSKGGRTTSVLHTDGRFFEICFKKGLGFKKDQVVVGDEMFPGPGKQFRGDTLSVVFDDGGVFCETSREREEDQVRRRAELKDKFGGLMGLL